MNRENIDASLRHLAALARATGWQFSSSATLSYTEKAVVRVSIVAPDTNDLHRRRDCEPQEVDRALDELKQYVREYLDYRILHESPEWGNEVRGRIAAADAAFAKETAS